VMREHVCPSDTVHVLHDILPFFCGDADVTPRKPAGSAGSAGHFIPMPMLDRVDEDGRADAPGAGADQVVHRALDHSDLAADQRLARHVFPPQFFGTNSP
jgi:hypothetical protein